ncbi:DUF4159 domain-containing protein [Flaviflagellibacter deserti]|uniref:DUF4159 domain-containing protein n=1 Tax=Flaviflagellibacter deserti TaxID=2267266 RepID=A0ABV9YVA7_9HYPH
MSALGLAFLSPWMLTALLGLPALYWLLRLVPPRPRKVDFPPLRLLLDIVPTEETAARTPWWLVALRLGLAALIILFLAGPILNPASTAAPGSGPLLLLVDDGWPAAPDWEARIATAEAELTAAETADRPVALLGLSGEPADIVVGTASQARDALKLITPQPFTRDRTSHLPAISRFVADHAGSDVTWLSDGLETGNGRGFADPLSKLGNDSRLAVHVPQNSARALAAADNAPDALTARVLRAETGTGETGLVRAFDLRGRPLGETRYTLGANETETKARLEMPLELRNEVARIELTDGRSAGGVQLLDERWRRRAVGIVSGATSDTAQPLLSPVYYLSRALEPFADVRNSSGGSPSDSIQRFIEDGVPVIALADVGTLTPHAKDALTTWVQNGGMLLRFAGTRLAAAEGDDLVPVRLRRGGRVLGGALAWSTPQPLGQFPPESPFAGLPVTEDVVVNRQVLAEPDPDLASRTWAVLGDGTPLVTARHDGQGLLVLFHVTADTVWSNLPISGLFVEMLRRTVALAGEAPRTTEAGAAAASNAPAPETPSLSPTRTLDGSGAFRAPPPTAQPVPATGLAAADATHPPGIYGPPDGFVAVNALAPDAKLARLDLNGITASVRGYANVEPTRLAPWLLVGALIAFLVDTLLVLILSGSLQRIRRRGAVAGILLALAFVAAPPPASAQDVSQKDLQAALRTSLAYIITGDRTIDETSEAGLRGLSLQLSQRTAFEPGDPIGVDPARDEMAFYPLIYWPVGDNAPALSSEAVSRVDAYMKRGGTILFDTRDAIYSATGSAPESSQSLRRILAGLDIPELEQVPANHVLTKSFYLLPDFPGRYRTGPLWVEALPTAEQTESGEADPVRSGDGVSPILITSNDLAGAWAIDERGQPMLPTVPSDPRQREMAYRAGINIVMYALTGNYKADQVHIPALLERLGQ